MNRLGKTFLILSGIFALVLALIIFIYTTILPILISNDKVLNFIENKIEELTDADLIINNPKLITGFSPLLTFSVDDLALKNNDEYYLNIKNFNTQISFKKIFKNELIIKKLTTDYIFADTNKILSLFPSKENSKTTNNSSVKIDIFNAILLIKDVQVLFSTVDGLNVEFLASEIKTTQENNRKYLHFNTTTNLEKNNKKLSFKLNDENTVFVENKKLTAQDTDLSINNSNVTINLVAKQDNTFDLNLHSKNFNFTDATDLVNSNILIPNGEELLALLSDIKGNFNFDINLNNSEMNGNVKINNLYFTVPCFANIPVTFTSGNLLIGKKDIKVENFKGYHGKDKNNKLDFSGMINNYMTTFDTSIEGFADAGKEFTTDYLSKTINYPIEMVGQTKSKIKVNMQDGAIDLAVIFRLIKGYDILVDGSSLTPVDYERAFRADMTIKGDNLELKNLNYYIADSFQAGVVAKPLLQMFGNFNAYTGAIKNVGFEIVKPLPSEFLNLFLGERVFRKGKIDGKIEYIADKKEIPYLEGNLSMDGVRIPSQRLSIKKGRLKAKDNLISLDLNGRFKRSEYDFTSKVANAITLPIVVKDINLKVDNLDVERILKSFSNQPKSNEASVAEMFADTAENEAKSDEEIVINTDFLVIENCVLEIVKGVYKQINFGNVLATMTLNRQGVLDLYSNRFDIADGFSSAKINCDLKNQIYKMKLGVKNVNSDAIATSLLNLPRELTGKAKGFIELETDKTFKLNGKMKFNITDGSIAKVGLIEYALNFVSLFRNPLTMISPSIFYDLVNIPEGDFKTIDGSLTLKDNVITRMMIKSQAPKLASFIVGRYDLENADATLRIYTRFTNKKKGVAGVLRNISLNSLANKILLSSRNDANYYSAEISQIPEIDAPDEECQIFLTTIDGDVEHNNFLSTLKKIK